MAVKSLAGCSTRGGSPGMHITFASAMQIRLKPLWLWNPDETSLEIQNRGTSCPRIGHVNVTVKKTFFLNKKILDVTNIDMYINLKVKWWYTLDWYCGDELNRCSVYCMYEWRAFHFQRLCVCDTWIGHLAIPVIPCFILVRNVVIFVPHQCTYTTREYVLLSSGLVHYCPTDMSCILN